MIKNIIGLCAGFGTTFSFFPQVLHIYRSTTTEGLSPYMMMIHFSGVSLWVAYGVLISYLIIISFNTITLFFVTAIFARYIYLKKPSQLQQKNDLIAT